MLDRMRLPKFRYVISAGAILGFAIPAVVMALDWLHIFRIPRDIAPFHLAQLNHAHGNRNAWLQLTGFCDPHVEHRLECPFICHRLHIILVTRLGVACSADIFARWNNDLTSR